MEYIIFIEDELHRNALKRYYEKYYKNKVNVIFINYDEYNDNLGTRICIGDKVLLDRIGLSENCIYVSDDDYSSFSIYQSSELLFKKLIEYKVDIESIDGEVRIYGVCGLSGNSGTSTLSMNISHNLAKESKTLFLSLEKIPSGKIYLEQSSGNSLSNALFYLKKNSNSLLSKLENLCSYNSKYKFYYFSDVEYLEDILEADEDVLNSFVETLRESKFQNIVIDFGTRLELFCKLSMFKKLFVTEQDLTKYKQLESVSKYIEKYDICNYLLINKKRHDMFINESFLNSFKNWIYIPYDFTLANNTDTAISKEILNELKDII